MAVQGPYSLKLPLPSGKNKSGVPYLIEEAERFSNEETSWSGKPASSWSLRLPVDCVGWAHMQDLCQLIMSANTSICVQVWGKGVGWEDDITHPWNANYVPPPPPEDWTGIFFTTSSKRDACCFLSHIQPQLYCGIAPLPRNHQYFKSGTQLRASSCPNSWKYLVSVSLCSFSSEVKQQL